MLARLRAAALGLVELIGPVPPLAEAAVDERIREAGHVARRLPHRGVQDDRGVERDDVVPLAHHRLEPARLHVLLEQHAVVAVVVRGAEPAVDLRGREDEPAPARERDDLVHRDGVGHRARRYSPRSRRLLARAEREQVLAVVDHRSPSRRASRTRPRPDGTPRGAPARAPRWPSSWGRRTWRRAPSTPRRRRASTGSRAPRTPARTCRRGARVRDPCHPMRTGSRRPAQEAA